MRIYAKEWDVWGTIVGVCPWDAKTTYIVWDDELGVEHDANRQSIMFDESCGHCFFDCGESGRVEPLIDTLCYN